MGQQCTNCGSHDTRKSTDNEFYFSGQSHYCNDCDELFTPSDYEDNRESVIGSETGSQRFDWEPDDDYQDRKENLDNI